MGPGLGFSHETQTRSRPAKPFRAMNEFILKSVTYKSEL